MYMRRPLLLILPVLLLLGLTGQMETVPPQPAAISHARPRTGTAPVRILALGDVMLGRNVRVLMDRNGPDHPFRNLTGAFLGYDLILANLEGPVLRDAPRTPAGGMRFAFPPEAAAALRRAGVSAVSLANNHTGDQGAQGFQETRRLLAAQDLSSFGQPGPAAETEPWLTAFGGRDFGFLAWNATGPAFDSAAALRLVSQTRRLNPDAFLWVSMHWGNEYESLSSPAQQELARALADAGADIVIGHHPHVVQEVEVYHGKPIFYSLGNFIFDQYFSKETQEGLGVAVRIGATSTVLDLLPFDLGHSSPKLAPAPAAQAWLAELAAKSAPDLRAAIRAGELVLPRPSPTGV